MTVLNDKTNCHHFHNTTVWRWGRSEIALRNKKKEKKLQNITDDWNQNVLRCAAALFQVNIGPKRLHNGEIVNGQGRNMLSFAFCSLFSNIPYLFKFISIIIIVTVINITSAIIISHFPALYFLFAWTMNCSVSQYKFVSTHQEVKKNPSQPLQPQQPTLTHKFNNLTIFINGLLERSNASARACISNGRLSSRLPSLPYLFSYKWTLLAI